MFPPCLHQTPRYHPLPVLDNTIKGVDSVLSTACTTGVGSNLCVWMQGFISAAFMIVSAFTQKDVLGISCLELITVIRHSDMSDEVLCTKLSLVLCGVKPACNRWVCTSLLWAQIFLHLYYWPLFPRT